MGSLSYKLKGIVKNITEGPNDCYHSYKIWSPSGNISGHYYGLPWQGSGTQFTCQESNSLHSFLSFDVNPDAIISIKDPGNTEGFNSSNCIKFMGTYDSPQFMMNVLHINDPNALGGPAFAPSLMDFATMDACHEFHNRRGGSSRSRPPQAI
jgi:hypothetical protein|tara:strand:- start:3144 stop:3599 length:456 start_codon:yes stop_codon:yes gene_type:complete